MPGYQEVSMKTGTIWKISIVVALIGLNLLALLLRKSFSPARPEAKIVAQKRFTNPAFKKDDERIQGCIKTLKQESLEQSLEALSIPDMYFTRGPPAEESIIAHQFPFPPRFGRRYLQWLMSNRRLLKPYQGLAALP